MRNTEERKPGDDGSEIACEHVCKMAGEPLLVYPKQFSVFLRSHRLFTFHVHVGSKTQEGRFRKFLA